MNLYASREEEKRDDIETRYVTQLGSSLTTMQKRMYAPGCPDKDAKESRTRLLNTLSKEELDYLRDQPTLRTIEDFTQEEAQKIVLLAQETRNDPLYNHKEMERRKLTVLFSAEFAEAVLLPDNDPTETAEQAREQLMENLILAKGVPVPVSPRDNHLIHIQVLKQTSTAIAEKAGGGDPEALGILTNIVKHWSDHFNELANSGIDKNTLAEMKKELTGVAKHIGELQAQQQQAAQSGQTPDAAPAGEQLAAAPSPDLAPAPVAPSA